MSRALSGLKGMRRNDTHKKSGGTSPCIEVGLRLALTWLLRDCIAQKRWYQPSNMFAGAKLKERRLAGGIYMVYIWHTWYTYGA